MSEKKYLEQRIEELEKDVQMLKELMKVKKKEPFSQREDPIGETISVNEATKLLGMERHILYAKCNSGEIPFFRVGKLYRFKKEELLEWINAQKKFSNVNTDELVAKYLQRNPIKG